jgi:hypothetical protein
MSDDSKDDGFSIDFSNEDRGWTNDICCLLSNYEHNCSTLANGYKNSYLELIQISKLFKIPIIFLSSANSIVSVGLSTYLPKYNFSDVNTNCVSDTSFLISISG